MTRFRLRIEYDGRPFMGWQRQEHGPSVQAAIEDALTSITGTRAPLHAAGRTDAGVHARGQVAHARAQRQRLLCVGSEHRRLHVLVVAEGVIEEKQRGLRVF